MNELAAQCVRDVSDELELELDYQLETLPILDHYCRLARTSPLWPDHAEHLATNVGCYFGEVLRRHFADDCRWVVSDEGLHQWRLEFARCFFCFNPLGMALELLLEAEATGWNAEMITLPEADDDLCHYLDRLGGVSEEDFYTLSVRSEVIETVRDFLDLWEDHRETPRHDYTSKEYDDHLTALQADMTASLS